jgi:reverse gyrase
MNEENIWTGPEEIKRRDWRKLHNEELYNLYSSSSIITMLKSRKVGWAGHVAQICEKMNARGWWESQKEREH